jgi:hypothetical protein
VPISQNSSLADSCQISFIGGYASGDGISFDDLEFDFSLNIPSISDYMVTVFPNPFTDYITINNPGNTELIFELYDMSGKRCMLKNATDVVILPRNHKLVNTESISSGSYVVILRNDDERHSITIMKN